MFYFLTDGAEVQANLSSLWQDKIPESAFHLQWHPTEEGREGGQSVDTGTSSTFLLSFVCCPSPVAFAILQFLKLGSLQPSHKWASAPHTLYASGRRS
jgi:hypothetical protein